MTNVNNNSVVYVPPSGTVFFDCSKVIIFGYNAEFFISAMVKNSSYTVREERSNNDTSHILLVTDNEKAFSTPSAETVKCCEMLLEGKCFLWLGCTHV